MCFLAALQMAFFSPFCYANGVKLLQDNRRNQLKLKAGLSSQCKQYAGRVFKLVNVFSQM